MCERKYCSFLIPAWLFLLVAGPLPGAGQAITGKPDEPSVSARPYYYDPALSPDGTEIAFVSGGDIWTVPANGGEARLLVSHPETESRPVYSPDGRYLAFNSTRTGNGDIYILGFQTGECRRLTYDDANDEISAWSPDGKYIYFSSTSREISSMRDIFRVKAEGGTPMPVSNNQYTNEFFAMPSPDGKTLAFNARGIASNQWWRNGRSHLDESEIWLMHENKPAGGYERITERGAKQLWPMWSKDASGLYYVSDKSGVQNLWFHPLKGEPKQLTTFTAGRVLWPSMAANGLSIVFERDFAIWKYDVSSAEARAVAIKRRGAPAGAGTEHLKLSGQFRELALSPDGKKAAFVAHGEVFVTAAKEGGDAMRVTTTGSNQSLLTWAPNSNMLVYLSDRDRVLHFYQYDFLTGKESRLTNESSDDASPVFSPNGKSLAFVRNAQELKVLDLATRKETLVCKGYFLRPPFTSSGNISWSPDGKWLAFAGFGTKAFRNVYVAPATGGAAIPVSFLANTNGGNVHWSHDGKYLLFETGQRTENSYVARVDLVPQRPKFREEQFQQMFMQQNTAPSSPVNPAAPKPNADSVKTAKDTLLTSGIKSLKAAEAVMIVTEGIRQRLNLLPLGIDVNESSISADGKTLLLNASVAGQQNLYTYSLDELAREPAVVKQITFTPGGKSDAQFTADSKEVYYLEQGRMQSVSLDTRQSKPIPVTAEMDVDFKSEKAEMFYQAWEALNKGFYDPEFHGKNWKAIKAVYEPLALGANTYDELRRIISLMIGELNASHSGISGPPGGGSFTTGRIGLLFDRTVYENSGKFKITDMLPLGAAALSGSIHPGDYLTAIDNVLLTASDNIDRLLENKVNRRVSLTLSATASGSNAYTVMVRPVNLATEKGLLYKQWAKQQRDYVAAVSNNRLGYVHMFDMSQQSLDQLYLDMDAENHSREGVVVDVRNNNGGFVNAYALDVLSRKGYMTMTNRGLPSAPARTQLGQRALDAPTILVTNQHSLSDAEDFTEGYRTLGLGKVVGEPTAGWIIYTSSVQLIDGSSIRMPFIKITDHEGKNMELNPRQVDIPVSRMLGEGTGKDTQLDVAVKELLKELDAAKKLKGNKGLTGTILPEGGK